VSGVELVIFDCDGVLVDSEGISSRVLAHFLTDAGLPTSPEEALRDYLGPRLAEVAALTELRLGRSLGSDWLPSFERARAEAFRSELRPVRGACVASQAGLEKTRLSLALTGLADLFPERALFSAEQVARGKPHPDLFLHAAEAMGVDAPRCVVVEDTPRGVAAAVAAGMRVLGFTAGCDRPELLWEAGTETFSSLGELSSLLALA
jgi:beta-phosphoglucomutase-like phosphatase (HAD superfamily)